MPFPETRWSVLQLLKDGDPENRDMALATLVDAYWKPLYAYLRCEHSREDAEDLLQQFFQEWLVTDILKRADAAKGRFRSFLLTCLKNFVSNANRSADAKKRRPIGGLFSLEDLIASAGLAMEPRSRENPEDAYHRVWVQNLIDQVLQRYANQCLDAKLDVRYELFRLRIVEPCLHGATQPSFAALGARFRLSENAANKAVLRAKSEFLQLLEQEVRGFAACDDEARYELESALGQMREHYPILTGNRITYPDPDAM